MIRCVECGCQIAYEWSYCWCPYCRAEVFDDGYPIPPGIEGTLSVEEFLGKDALAAADGKTVPLKYLNDVIGEAKLTVVEGTIHFKAELKQS
jgi:hypothetical protein